MVLLFALYIARESRRSLWLWAVVTRTASDSEFRDESSFEGKISTVTEKINIRDSGWGSHPEVKVFLPELSVASPAHHSHVV